MYVREAVNECYNLQYRGVAQLVARSAGGREVAGSSPVTPTRYLLYNEGRCLKNLYLRKCG